VDFLDRGESPANRIKRFCIFSPDFGDRVLGGDDDFLWSDVNSLLFDLGDKGQEVGPYLEVVGEVPVVDVHVFNDDDLLSLIAVPPLGERLEVRVGVRSVGGRGLSTSGDPMNPGSTYSIECWWPDHVIFLDLFVRPVVPDSQLGVDVFNVSLLLKIKN